MIDDDDDDDAPPTSSIYIPVRGVTCMQDWNTDRLIPIVLYFHLFERIVYLVYHILNLDK
jgi:hypothetical protein